MPGAVFADLVNDLSDTTQPIGFAVPTPAAFCEAMGRLGVGDDSQVVFYDDRMQLPGMTFSSIWAARVWWMLRWVGFDSAALLDGGFGAWRDGGHPLSSDVESSVTATLTPRPRPQLIVGHRIRPHTDRPPRRRGVHSLTPRMGGRPGQSDGDPRNPTAPRQRRSGSRRPMTARPSQSSLTLPERRPIVRHAPGEQEALHTSDTHAVNNVAT